MIGALREALKKLVFLGIFPKPVEACFWAFFWKKKFSWQNGRLSPIACLTDSESYWSRG